MSNRDPRLLQMGNVAAVVIAVTWNALVNILPLNGVNTGVVSDSYPNLFTPPGYVFTIWGVIYALAFVFALYQMRSSQRSSDYLGSIGWLYLGSTTLNVSWLLLFHYSYGFAPLLLASTFVLLLLLADLLAIYVRLGVGVGPTPLGIKLAVHVPMSIYLGWISVASIAAVASTINAMVPGIPLEAQATITASMLAVCLALTGFMLWARRDIVFALVVVWAVIGISTKQVGIPMVFSAALAVAGMASVAMLLIPAIRRMSLVSYYLS